MYFVQFFVDSVRFCCFIFRVHVSLVWFYCFRFLVCVSNLRLTRVNQVENRDFIGDISFCSTVWSFSSNQLTIFQSNCHSSTNFFTTHKNTIEHYGNIIFDFIFPNRVQINKMLLLHRSNPANSTVCMRVYTSTVYTFNCCRKLL